MSHWAKFYAKRWKERLLKFKMGKRRCTQIWISYMSIILLSAYICLPNLLYLVFTSFLYFSKFFKMYFQSAWTTRKEAVVDTPATSKYVKWQVSKSPCCQEDFRQRENEKGTLGYSRKNPHLPDRRDSGNSRGRGGQGPWKSRWEGNPGVIWTDNSRNSNV